MNPHIPILFLSIFGVPSYGDITTCEMSSQQVHYQLRKDLLCDYYSEIRPQMDHRKATKVFVKMIIQSYTYELFSNTITVNSWMPMSWMDDHLKWKPSDYENIELVHFQASELWTPDLALYNKHRQESVHKILDSNMDCIVRYTGTVTCVPPNSHDAICMNDLRYFPYDKLTCVLKLGSWVHTGEVIDFQFNKVPAVINNSTSNDEWKLLNVTMKRQKGIYECCPNSTYPSLIFTFTLERYPSYHEATIVIPALVILMIVLFTFSLNATENERLYLIIFSILLHLLFIMNLFWELPKVGNNTPNIVIFTRDSLIICIVQYVITLILRWMIKSPENNAGWITGTVITLVQSRIGQAILVFDNSVKAVAIAKGDEDGANIIERTQTANNLDYIVFAKLLDRLLCVIFIIIYVTMYIRLVF